MDENKLHVDNGYVTRPLCPYSILCNYLMGRTIPDIVINTSSAPLDVRADIISAGFNLEYAFEPYFKDCPLLDKLVWHTKI